jgi:circadian clock protein KaiB
MKQDEPQGGMATDTPAKVVLCLYVAGNTPISTRAIVNVRDFCERNLKGHYELSVVNVSEHPELAAREQLVALPTLVRVFPTPPHRLVGDLRDKERMEIRLRL